MADTGATLTALTFDLLQTMRSNAWKESKWIYLETKQGANMVIEKSHQNEHMSKRDWSAGPSGMRCVYVYKAETTQAPAISERTRVAVGAPRFAVQEVSVDEGKYGFTETGRPKKKCNVCGKTGVLLL